MALSGTLLAGALLTLAAGLAYLAAGIRLSRQAPRKGHAIALFSLFWFALGFYGIADGLWSLAVPLANPPVALGITILHLKTLIGCAGFLGLVYYLLYLYTGNRRILLPLVLFYALVYVLVLYSYIARHPIGQETQTWRSGLVYANDGGLLDTLAVIALFLPPLLASIAYARLATKVQTPQQRRRVLAISASLAVFFGSLLAGWLGMAGTWWPLAEKILAVATGGVVVAVLGE